MSESATVDAMEALVVDLQRIAAKLRVRGLTLCSVTVSGHPYGSSVALNLPNGSVRIDFLKRGRK